MKPALALLLLTLALAGCGYTSLQSGSPFGVRRLALVPFGEAQPAGLAPDLAQALALELAASGLEIAPSRATADGVLTGEILSVTTVPSSAAGGVLTYSIRVLLSARLTVGGKEPWKKEWWVAEDYLPGVGGTLEHTLATETNRREALRRVALLAAQQLRSALLLEAAAR